MSDLIKNVFSTDSRRLAELFSIGTEPKRFSAEELQENLDHLLGIPLPNAVNQLPGSLAEKLRGLAAKLEIPEAAEAAGIASFRDLFGHSAPPLVLLKFAKDFGKSIHMTEGAAWPSEVGLVLYYLGIGTAIVRVRQRISALSTADLRTGFKKISKLPWIDDPIRKLCEAVLAQLSSKPISSVEQSDAKKE